MNTFGFISLFSRSWYILRLDRSSPTLQKTKMMKVGMGGREYGNEGGKIGMGGGGGGGGREDWNGGGGGDNITR